MVNGDDVYRMFLKSPDYMAFKDRMLREDSSYSDPGRTTFLETRCGWLRGSPVVMFEFSYSVGYSAHLLGKGTTFVN